MGLSLCETRNLIERIAYEGSRRSMKRHFTSYLFDKVSGDVSKEEGRARSEPALLRVIASVQRLALD